MTFSSFRQDARNDKVAETMTYKSVREEAWNDTLIETMAHLAVSDRKPGMIRL